MNILGKIITDGVTGVIFLKQDMLILQFVQWLTTREWGSEDGEMPFHPQNGD